MYEGEEILKKVLGSRSYKKLIAELQKDSFDESSYFNLAKVLQLEEYFRRLKKAHDIDKPDVPRCLLACWAKYNSENVTYSTLSRIFHKANMGKAASIFQYNNDFSSSLTRPKKFLKIKCLESNTTPTESPVRDLHFSYPEPNDDLSLVYKDVDRNGAEGILKQERNGSYLVRMSSNNKDFVITLNKNGKIEHYLILHQKAVNDDQNQLFTVKGRNKSFSSLKALLDEYKGSFNLLHLKTPEVKTTKIINPVFVEKFCQELETSSNSVIADLVEVFSISEEFKEHCSNCEPEEMTKQKLGEWILNTWIDNNGDLACLSLFQTSICSFEDGKDVWEIVGGHFELA